MNNLQTAIYTAERCDATPYRAAIAILQAVPKMDIVAQQATVARWINELPDPVARHNCRVILARLIAYMGGNVNE